MGRRRRRSAAPIGRRTRQVSTHFDLGDIVGLAKLLVGESQIQQPTVVGAELDAGPTEDGFEVGVSEADFAGTDDDAARPQEAFELVGSAGDRFAVTRHQTAAGDSTEILHD